MNKYLMIGLVLTLTITTVLAASNYRSLTYYVEDKVSGKNLQVIDFTDEYGLIDNLIYQDQLKSSKNKVSGYIGYGISEDGTEDVFKTEKLKLSGKANFNGKSYVTYEVVNFEDIETDVDEYGTTMLTSQATLKYKQVIEIEREVPVEVSFDFFQDPEDKESFGNLVEIIGDDVYIVLEDEGEQTFRHSRKCYSGCE